MGECRLVERDETWYFHVTATRDVVDHSSMTADERTPIGVDVGEASLVTVCHRDENGSPVRPKLWADDGKAVRRLRKTYFTATRRLQKRGSKRIAESYGHALWNQIDDVFHRVTREVVKYAESVENPVLVLEDLTYIRENMDYGEYMNRRLHGWGFAKLRTDPVQSCREGDSRRDGGSSEHVESMPRLRRDRLSTTTVDVPLFERRLLGYRVPSGRERGDKHRRPLP